MMKHLRWGISLGLLLVLAQRLDWDNLLMAFAGLRLSWWLGAVVLLALAQCASARRWQLFARELRFQRSYLQLLRYYFVGMFFNNFMPSSVGGDVMRAWCLDGRDGRKLAAFVSVGLDRVSGLAVLVAIACVAVVCSPLRLPAFVPWVVGSTAAVALSGGAALVLLARLRWLPAQRQQQIEAMMAIVRSPRTLAETTLHSVLVQAASVGIVWLVGQALGLEIPLSYYAIFVPMVTLVTTVPVSLSGIGVRENATVLFLAPLGVNPGAATALSVLWFAVNVALSVVGGVVYFASPFSQAPAEPAVRNERREHGPLGGDSSQGRERQRRQAA